MTRPLMLILLGLLLTGCKSQAPTCDPFFPRTTIPSPPTGAAVGRPSDPGYQTPPVVQTAPQMPAAVAPPQVQLSPQASAGATTFQPSTAPQLPPCQPPAAAATPQPAAPAGLVPNISAPRPTSTAPPGAQPARPSSLAPPAGAAGPFVPPGGSNSNYRGASTQGSTPLVPTQPDTRTSLPSMAGFSNGRTITVSEERTPKPIEDASADGSIGGRKATTQLIQPRPRNATSDRPVDIMDLPPAAGSAGVEAKPLRPAGP